MIANIKRSEVLSGLRKAAILMVVLGEESSARLVRCGSCRKTRVQTLSREMARISTIDNPEGEAVLEEFYQMCMARDYVVRGGIEYASKVLVNAFGPETAKKLVDRLVKTHEVTTAAAFDALQKADPQQLSQVRFTASIRKPSRSSCRIWLRRKPAAALLVSLPARDARGCGPAHGQRLDQISPEIIHKIAAVIGQKLQSLGEFSRESYGGVRAVSEMFNLPGIGQQQGDSGGHRKGERHAGGHHPASDVRLRGHVAGGGHRSERSCWRRWIAKVLTLALGEPANRCASIS